MVILLRIFENNYLLVMGGAKPIYTIPEIISQDAHNGTEAA